ncbi:MAG: hypothetical protein WCS86_03095 [Candidatus Paceibacterota bacterium]
MKKYIFKILIIALILLPSVSKSASFGFYVGIDPIQSSDITESSVVLKGKASRDSNETTNPSVVVYFKYSIASIDKVQCGSLDAVVSNGSIIPISSTQKTNIGTLSQGFLGQKSFSRQIGNLRPDTDYYYCAIVKNSAIGLNINDNTSISEIGTFHTLSPKLFVNTEDVGSINKTTATLRGTGGESPEATHDITGYFKYSNTAFTSCKTDGTPTAEIPLGKASSKIFSQKLDDLEPQKIYYYCAITKNSIGNVAYGVIKKFFTGETLNTTPGTTSNLFNVETVEPVTNITQTSAILHGKSSLNNNIVYASGCSPTSTYSVTTGLLCNNLISPITGYFRYSKASINPPIFCNDIYGTNMIATKDIPFGKDANGKTITSKNFSIEIDHLIPNTKYYYCAIVSNRENITYGGSQIVQSFYTSPLDTTVSTTDATRITSNSAVINGTYSSVKDVRTYFMVKKFTPPDDSGSGAASFNFIKDFIFNKLINTALAITNDIPTKWTKIDKSEQIHKIGNYSNLHGNINYSLTGLEPETIYQYYAVAEDIKITKTGNITNISVLNKIDSEPLKSFITKANPTAQKETLGTGEDACPSGYTGTPPNCTYTENTCTNGATNPPACSVKNGKCVNGATNPPACNTNTSCPSNQIYNPAKSICEDKKTCPAMQVYDYSTSICVTPPTNCEVNSTDPRCLPGPGWTWTGDGWKGAGWNGGMWTGGGVWNGGTWSGGTWTGSLGTWSGGTWRNGVWTGGNWNGTLTLGQISTPPVDAVVRFQEGIETVFARQIVANTNFAKLYGYEEGTDLQTFAWSLSDQFARVFGYVNSSGKEIRVSYPDVAAYQLQLTGNKLTVYEYYYNKIVDIRNVTTVFKNASGYEYYFKK